jgi:hypothetical protein
MQKIYVRELRTILMMVSLILLSWQIAYATESSQIIKKELPRSGKATAPISVSYSVPANVAIGDNVHITVTVKALSDVDNLSLKLIAGENLQMPSGELLKTYGNQLRNSAFSETVTVIPNTEGILYLNVFATGIFNGKKMTSAGAVPINTGTGTRKMLKKSGQIKTDSRGQKVIVMPAEEVKNQTR